MRDKKVTFIVQAAVIAALYVVLTFVANALGLASHTIQVRFSEALCILPVFTPAAIPGLWIGCLLLSYFIYNGLNMTNIQSRPKYKNWNIVSLLILSGRFEDGAEMSKADFDESHLVFRFLAM